MVFLHGFPPLPFRLPLDDVPALLSGAKDSLALGEEDIPPHAIIGLLLDSGSVVRVPTKLLGTSFVGEWVLISGPKAADWSVGVGKARLC